ncbi:hypothetical protein [Roseobacter sp. TSBP12]|uniref:hypothetical protein n=1 Tax=Roseobacter sp. TSBP12 TaxID=1236613 RepID=UPI00125EED1D|nr:hypothetical protein [Roseobacter sp. TSBP12]KAB6717708.1 hypothetical protein C8029_04095 [Roseobacter sp. TSBP12]
MTRQFKPQVSFNSGEVSPLLYGRNDYKRVRTGVREMRGFIPLREGGFTRAPGTIFRGYTKDNAAARLLPFEFNANDSLNLEFTNETMRVWRYGELVELDGSAYELTVPYGEADLDAIWPLQSSDVIYLADGSGPLQKLSRYALNNWTINDWVLDTGPFRVQNLDEDITIQCSASTGTITLTGSGDPFEVSQVGSLILLKPTNITEIPLWSSNTAAQIGNYFRYDENIYQITAGKTNGDGIFDTTTGTTVNTGVSPPIHSYGEMMYDFNTKITWKYISDLVGIVRITSVSDENSAIAEVIKTVPEPCVTDPTYRWSEGAWSVKYGYPRTIEIIKQRFAAAATRSEPRTLWFSTIGDFNDFLPSIEPDEAFAYAIDGSEGQNGIQWLRRSRKGIYIGTLGEVVRGFSSQVGQAIGISTFDTDVEGTNGSIAHRPISPFGYPIYITADATRVEELRYSFEVEGGLPVDLTVPAAHIGAAGLSEIVWQSNPLGLAWLRRDDGDLVLMLYNQSEEVLGWSIVSLAGGFVESFSVTSSSDGKRDILTMVVKRTINGEVVRMIEEQAIVYGALPGDDPIHEANHLFASKVFDLAEPTDTFDISHLIGEEVYAWTDNGQFGPITVPESGEITLESSVSYAIIGLFDQTHFVDLFEPSVEEKEGDARGMGKSIASNGGIVLHRTAAGYVRGVERHFGQEPMLNPRQPLFDVGVAANLTTAYSGVTNISAFTGMSDEASYRFEPFGGAPMTVLAIVSPVETGGA